MGLYPGYTEGLCYGRKQSNLMPDKQGIYAVFPKFDRDRDFMILFMFLFHSQHDFPWFL